MWNSIEPLCNTIKNILNSLMKLSAILLLSLLLGLARSEIIEMSGVQGSQSSNAADHNVENYDGNCEIPHSDGSCEMCYQGYYYDSKDALKCIPVNPDCQTYNKDGECLTCYEGYTPDKGICVVSSSIPQKDANCAKFDVEDEYNCLECSYRYYFNEKKVCINVSPNCESWDVSGQCMACYPGYVLINGKCIQEQVIIPIQSEFQPYSSDDFCAKWEGENDDRKCVQCEFRAVSIDQKCYRVSDQCKQWDDSAYCTQCYDKFELYNGTCLSNEIILAANAALEEKKYENCNKRNTEEGICEKCSWRFYKRENGYCAQISDLCKEWNDTTGQCTDCYKGYELQEGVCYIPDIHCTVHSINYGCVQCQERFFLGADKICARVNALCDEYDVLTGKCITCISGYTYEKSGKCIKE